MRFFHLNLRPCLFISHYFTSLLFFDQHLYFNNKTSSAHSSSVNALESLSDSFRTVFLYCAFQKHGNSEVLKPPLQLRFSLRESIIIIIMITSNKPQNTETHKTDRNAPIKNHKQWPFELACERQTFLFPAGGRFVRRNVCDSATEIPYWWRKSMFT